MTQANRHGPVRLGLRENAGQFALLVGVNALVGGMIGQERTVLPLLAERVFELTAFTAALTFIVAFGATKAVTNFFAGTLSDRLGRKPVLVAGWLVGVPVPFLIMWAPVWGWVIVANVLLGVNQGLTWSTTVIMKIDLVGPARRGLAMGLNEAAGYVAVAVTALATGFIAAEYGLRPEPFFLGVAYAGLGLGLSTLFVRETHGHVAHEAAMHRSTDPALHGDLSTAQVFTLTSFTEPALSSCSQAGMVNNLNDGLAWGLFPLYFAAAGLSVGRIGVLAALYPAVWGLGQLASGTLSDRIGRKGLIAGGMLTQAAAIGLIAASSGFAPWAVGAALLGLGTAMVYPTLLAAIGDVAHPTWRASAVGVYRLWRDGGFAIGALLAGFVADALGIRAAIWAGAGLTAASGVVVLLRMYETHPRRP
jgi:MFS family permease